MNATRSAGNDIRDFGGTGSRTTIADAEDFRRRALEAVESAAARRDTPVRWFVLNIEANVEVDPTALDVVEQLRAEFHERGIVFAMARVGHDLRAALDASGLASKIGAQYLYPTLPTAVAAFEADRRPESDGPSGE